MKHTYFRLIKSTNFPLLLAKQVDVEEWKRECQKIIAETKDALVTTYMVQDPDNIGYFSPPGYKESVELDLQLNVLTATYRRKEDGIIDRVEQAMVFYLNSENGYRVLDMLRSFIVPTAKDFNL